MTILNLKRIVLPLILPLILCSCQQIRLSQATDRTVKGILMMEDDDYEQALAEFREAVKLNPQLAVAYSRMGNV